MATRPKSLSLVGLFAALLLGDALLRRVMSPVLHVDLLSPVGMARDLVDWSGAFCYHASGLLGAGLATVGVARLVLFPSPVPRGGRAAVGGLGLAFLPLSLLGAMWTLPPLLHVYLVSSAAAISCLLALAVLIAPYRALPPRLGRRLKAGVVVAAAPLLARFAWLLATHGGGRNLDASSGLARFGGNLAAAAALLSLPLLWSRRGPWALALLAGLAATGAAFGLYAQDAELTTRLTGYGFGIELPLRPLDAGLYFVAFGAWSAATVGLIGRRGPSRLRGSGLLLVGLAGYDLSFSLQVSAALLGLLCLIESIAREERAADQARRFRELAEQLGRALAAPARIDEELGAARLACRRGESDDAVDITLFGEAGQVREIEIAVARAADEAAPLSLLRRGTPRYERPLGDEVQTGDAGFDAAFRTFDARRLSGRDPVLDDDLRPRLLDSAYGTLDVWPGEAVRYRSIDTTLTTMIGQERLPQLLDLLVALKSRR